MTASSSETLLVNSEAALRRAKATSERCVFYTPGLTEPTGARLTLESKLGRALERDEFVLYYQPKVDTAFRGIVGLEALIRWQSPELGLVPPANAAKDPSRWSALLCRLLSDARI